ncbi:ImmA/IrrE family metallo-endopeptidase [Bacillus sp. EB01]|uniref:ImmA/IrrE family metallo-endopeptidase n=1 Tax=Bacillus sp. EB01 TaxID=1347086 RepID=UPI0005C5550B|nr:ImmA/IrrE family metallo-endopeptidase [Bacillus sp. EB01]
MTTTLRNYIFLIFLLPSIGATILYIDIPKELEWNIILFLFIMVIFDQVNLKVFSGFGYSFFNVILSLIIFDRFSIVYGILYLLLDALVSILIQKRGRLHTIISLTSIYLLIIIFCNEIYNEYSDKDYLARYLTTLGMLLLTILLKYLYVFLETGIVSTKLFLERFGPMVFEVLLIFPILAFFDQLIVNLVLLLFLSYYTFIGYFHKKLISINQAHIDAITEKITYNYNINVLFLDLKEIKGVFHAGERLVVINEKLDYPEQLQTLIHELLHFHLRKYNLPKKGEEVIVTFCEAIISWYYIVTLKNRQYEST